jgi:hypothetical protein
MIYLAVLTILNCNCFLCEIDIYPYWVLNTDFTVGRGTWPGLHSAFPLKCVPDYWYQIVSFFCNKVINGQNYKRMTYLI